ncbi:MAG TPA: maltose alpha-D-glucosyltransferase [Anaerolineae bacterium]|nr:maltose alpha-D-glucosyltransferase [Caldilineae bacterium]HID34590.1 maltose alpha-D-glucosyltransferase [Anaerolineae bacterium]HIQ12074.1 maltose alpha-D-glucosyltransferase [Caldilineales bacterium]
MPEQPWWQTAVYYQLYLRSFADSNDDGIGDLQGVIARLDYLQWLGVNAIWLSPHYPSPRVDDGYDVVDHVDVHPDYGSLADFRALIAAAHDRDIRVLIDLIPNHTSDQHPWFQTSRRRQAPYEDFYVWSDDDARYQDARIIFLDTETSNWAWDEMRGQYYWHRFYRQQPDLNYDNPLVQEAMLDVMRFWLDLGVDGFRVDAVPYLFEREGTNCENLPETHAYLKRMRAMLDAEYPHAVMMSEANQPPVETLRYFGDDPGDEFHMCLHFPLMPRLFMALARGHRHPILDIWRATQPIPAGCQWATFLRNHDELTLEMVTPEERAWMWDVYAPAPRMRLNLGIRRRLAPLLENDRRKIELLFSLLFALPGAPIIYYGDEIGMGDNIWLPDRNGVRTPMQWDATPNAGFSRGRDLPTPVIDDPVYGYQRVNVADQQQDPHSLLHRVRQFIHLARAHPFLASAPIHFLDHPHPGILAFERPTGSGQVLFLHNLSDAPLTLDIPPARDMLTQQPLSSRQLTLPPYGYRWLKLTEKSKNVRL